jgi:hypothetical protein
MLHGKSYKHLFLEERPLLQTQLEMDWAGGFRLYGGRKYVSFSR